MELMMMPNTVDEPVAMGQFLKDACRRGKPTFFMSALMISVSVIAMAEVARPLRLINPLFGIWLVAAPWILSGASGAAAVGSVISGLLVFALSIPKGPVRNRYAGWDRLIM
jgi:hypothetical protein